MKSVKVDFLFLMAQGITSLPFAAARMPLARSFKTSTAVRCMEENEGVSSPIGIITPKCHFRIVDTWSQSMFF